MAKRKSTTLYDKRAFLNPVSEGGMAAIKADVQVTESETDIEVSASLGLSDCSNHIYLDFEVWSSSVSKRFLRDRRKKAQRLRTIINTFLDAVEEAYEELEEKAPEKLAAKKAKKKK
jgi:hypothetical protein